MTPREVVEAVSAALGQSKLGKSRRRVVIVAECNSIPKVKLWIDAVPTFNAERTAIAIEYQLVVDYQGKSSRTTVSDYVVNEALKNQEDVIIAAASSQYGWLRDNCPAFDEVIARHELNKEAKNPEKSEGAKRI